MPGPTRLTRPGRGWCSSSARATSVPASATTSRARATTTGRNLDLHGRAAPGVDRLYPGWFDFSGGLYSKGSEFEPSVHTETVRDDGTVGGVHNLEGIEGGGDNGSTARVEWSLRPAE